MHLHAYIHFERAGPAPLVVAATRMLDARPPGESMEHPLTTHSPSVSAYRPWPPPLAYFSHPSRSPSSWHSFRFLHPPRLSSSLCFHPSACQSLSPSFFSGFLLPPCVVSVFDLIPKRPPRLGFFSLQRVSTPPRPFFFSCACQFHPSFFTCPFLARLMRVAGSTLPSCNLRNVSPTLRRSHQPRFSSLKGRERKRERICYILISSSISAAIPPATDAQLYAISLC